MVFSFSDYINSTVIMKSENTENYTHIKNEVKHKK